MQPRARGFTLIELMVVVALIAIAAGLTSLALRDAQADQLEREAARLAALLEAARTEARASGVAVRWELAPADNSDNVHFRFVGLPPSSGLPQRWLGEGVQADIVGARALRLGPEPMVGAQRVVLRIGERALAIETDGLGPFEVRP